VHAHSLWFQRLESMFELLCSDCTRRILKNYLSRRGQRHIALPPLLQAIHFLYLMCMAYGHLSGEEQAACKALQGRQSRLDALEAEAHR